MANGLVALALLMGASAAQAQGGVDLETSMPCGVGDTNATGITNLELDGVRYDVEFKFDFGSDLFTLPLFFFPTDLQALTTTAAVSDVLDTKPLVTTVGPQMSNFYDVPFEFEFLVG